jgi:hypothetical protein
VHLEGAFAALLARDSAHERGAIVRVDLRVFDGTRHAHVKLPAVDQLFGVHRIDREIHALAGESLAPVARHGIRVIERPRLVQVDAQPAAAADFHGGDAALVVELLDGPDGAVGDVELRVALPKLHAIADGEAPVLRTLHVESVALVRVDVAHLAGALQLDPKVVPFLVHGYDLAALAGVDAVAGADEAQHVSFREAGRAALLFDGHVLLRDDRRLHALPFDLAVFDERFADAAVEVLALGVARGDDDAPAAVGYKVARDLLVSLARVADLDDAAGLLEELHGQAGAAALGRG